MKRSRDEDDEDSESGGGGGGRDDQYELYNKIGRIFENDPARPSSSSSSYGLNAGQTMTVIDGIRNDPNQLGKDGFILDRKTGKIVDNEDIDPKTKKITWQPPYGPKFKDKELEIQQLIANHPDTEFMTLVAGGTNREVIALVDNRSIMQTLYEQESARKVLEAEVKNRHVSAETKQKQIESVEKSIEDTNEKLHFLSEDLRTSQFFDSQLKVLGSFVSDGKRANNGFLLPFHLQNEYFFLKRLKMNAADKGDQKVTSVEVQKLKDLLLIDRNVFAGDKDNSDAGALFETYLKFLRNAIDDIPKFDKTYDEVFGMFALYVFIRDILGKLDGVYMKPDYEFLMGSDKGIKYTDLPKTLLESRLLYFADNAYSFKPNNEDHDGFTMDPVQDDKTPAQILKNVKFLYDEVPKLEKLSSVYQLFFQTLNPTPESNESWWTTIRKQFPKGVASQPALAVTNDFNNERKRIGAVELIILLLFGQNVRDENDLIANFISHIRFEKLESIKKIVSDVLEQNMDENSSMDNINAVLEKQKASGVNTAGTQLEYITIDYEPAIQNVGRIDFNVREWIVGHLFWHRLDLNQLLVTTRLLRCFVSPMFSTFVMDFHQLHVFDAYKQLDTLDTSKTQSGQLVHMISLLWQPATHLIDFLAPFANYNIQIFAARSNDNSPTLNAFFTVTNGLAGTVEKEYSNHPQDLTGTPIVYSSAQSKALSPQFSKLLSDIEFARRFLLPFWIGYSYDALSGKLAGLRSDNNGLESPFNLNKNTNFLQFLSTPNAQTSPPSYSFNKEIFFQLAPLYYPIASVPMILEVLQVYCQGDESKHLRESLQEDNKALGEAQKEYRRLIADQAKAKDSRDILQAVHLPDGRFQSKPEVSGVLIWTPEVTTAIRTASVQLRIYAMASRKPYPKEWFTVPFLTDVKRNEDVAVTFAAFVAAVMAGQKLINPDQYITKHQSATVRANLGTAVAVVTIFDFMLYDRLGNAAFRHGDPMPLTRNALMANNWGNSGYNYGGSRPKKSGPWLIS